MRNPLIGGALPDCPIQHVADGVAAATDAATTFLATLGDTANLEAAWLPGYELSYQTASGRLYGNAVVAPASGVRANYYDMILADVLGDTNPAAFNGTPGGASSSEYISFDGSSIIRSVAAPSTFIKSLAKDSANFSLMIAYYHATGGSASQHLFGTQNSSARQGIQIRINDTGWNTPEFFSWNNSGIAVSATHSGGALAAGWHIIGVSVDEAATTGHFIVDGTVDSFTSTYSTPTTSDPAMISIGGVDGSAATLPLNSGTRVGDIIMWNTAIGSSGLTTASGVLESKYGV